MRAITRKPSCLISCNQASPLGGLGALVGRHGGMKPAGRERGDMAVSRNGPGRRKAVLSTSPALANALRRI
jgi:hypothetical protein